jgi:beta-glucosidase
MGFPKDFAWGAASSAYQVEGGAYEDGKGLSIWDVCCRKPGFIKDGSTGDVACDNYHLYETDVGIMKEIGLKAYRLSISWPRVLPDGIGRINEKGLDFYDRLIDSLLKGGVVPYVTLFHWDYPYELHAKGGWLNPESPDWFAEYTRVVVERLSDRVTHWITQNEPQCFIRMGYQTGENAPGLKSCLEDALLAGHHSLLAHGKSVLEIRATAKRPCSIGYAPAGWWLWCPETDSAGDLEAARRLTFGAEKDQLGSSSWWMDPVCLGKYPEDGLARVGKAMPEIGKDDMKLIAQPIDFLGINIYQGYVGRMGPSGPENVDRPAGYAKQAYDWPIVPQSLYWGPRFLYDRYGVPIVITENGMSNVDWVGADGKVHDPQRIDFMLRYLRELKRASEDGVDVRGYFAWSLTDNFEWAQGFFERFGLAYVDFTTRRRTIKDSGYWYGDVIRSNGEALG